jgi:hypothetical protein
VCSSDLLEGLGRTAGLVFPRPADRPDPWPLFYRLPDDPVGEVYFRRRGPASWAGRPLHDGLELASGRPAASYRDEAPVTVAYDAEGFRNPPGPADWEVVVAGDSFVELGHLPDEDLFTTRYGRLAGVRVRNLGAAGAAADTERWYLAAYGRAPSARHAVLAFFEGNDVAELVRERRALERWRRTGEREERGPGDPFSILGAAWRRAAGAYRVLRVRRAIDEGVRFDAAGGPVPVTLDYAPPGRAGLTAEERGLLEDAIAQWGATARGLGMVPWVLYLPCKRRALDGRLLFSPRSPRRLREWRPGDLPAFVGELCARHGLRFIDATPALAAEAARGRLAFNPVWDTHLNALGAAVVAQVMAESGLAAATGGGRP